MPPAELELPLPPEFRCPISLNLMRDPVAGLTGITYDRAGIEAWLLAAAGRGTCPVTHTELRAEDLVPNHASVSLHIGLMIPLQTPLMLAFYDKLLMDERM